MLLDYVDLLDYVGSGRYNITSGKHTTYMLEFGSNVDRFITL